MIRAVEQALLGPPVLVSAAAAREDQVMGLVGAAGWATAPAGQPAPDAWLLVADLTDADAETRLAGVTRPEGAGLLCLVPDGDAAAVRRALALGADDFVAESAVERELGFRLDAQRRAYETRAELRLRAADGRLLVELTRSFAGTLDPGHLLPELTRKLTEALSLRRCSFVMVDASGWGTVVASSDAEAVSERRIDLARYPEIQEAIRTRRPIVLSDASRHPLLDPFREAIADLKLGGLAVLPLVLEDQIIGVLFLRASGVAFSDRQVAFATAVANAAAVALRNARSVAEIRTQVERAEARATQLARFEDVFDNALAGIAVTANVNGRLLALNPAGRAILGVGDEALGAKIKELLTPVDDHQFRTIVRRVAAGQQVRNEELEVVRKDGKRIELATSVARLSTADVVVHSFQDITEHNRARAELEQTKEFLERLIDSTVDGIIASDAEGKIILINKGAEAMLGHVASEVLGTLQVEALYPPGGAGEVMKMLRSPDHGGPGRLSAIRREVLHSSGELIPVQMTATLIEDGGNLLATVGIFSDLRERMRIEDKLQTTQEKLERSERQAMIVELAGTAAHELNQPLTSVMGYAELLRRKLKPDDASYRAVDIIFREAERMAEIVRKIGRITRYETKAYVGRQRIVDLDRSSGEGER